MVNRAQIRGKWKDNVNRKQTVRDRHELTKTREKKNGLIFITHQM